MTNANEMAQKGFDTGFTDANDNELHVGDYVRICGHIGKIVFSCGASRLCRISRNTTPRMNLMMLISQRKPRTFLTTLLKSSVPTSRKIKSILKRIACI